MSGHYSDQYIDLAVQYKRNGQYQQAVDTYLKLIDLLNTENDIKHKPATYRSLAKVYFLMRDADRCIQCCYNVVILDKLAYPAMRLDFENVLNKTADFITEQNVEYFVSENARLIGAAFLLKDTALTRKHKNGLYRSMLAYGGGKETSQIAAFKREYNASFEMTSDEIWEYENRCDTFGRWIIKEIMFSSNNVEIPIRNKDCPLASRINSQTMEKTMPRSETRVSSASATSTINESAKEEKQTKKLPSGCSIGCLAYLIAMFIGGVAGGIDGAFAMSGHLGGILAAFVILYIVYRILRRNIIKSDAKDRK